MDDLTWERVRRALQHHRHAVTVGREVRMVLEFLGYLRIGVRIRPHGAAAVQVLAEVGGLDQLDPAEALRCNLALDGAALALLGHTYVVAAVVADLDAAHLERRLQATAQVAAQLRRATSQVAAPAACELAFAAFAE